MTAGSGHFAAVIREIKKISDEVVIEVLIPDFQGDSDDLDRVIAACPHVINHNVETIPRLYSSVRPQAKYERSLELITRVKNRAPEIYTKSGFMAGLGETEAEVLELMKELKRAGCDLLTIGQYLSPSPAHYPVAEWVPPEVFEKYRIQAEGLGFYHVSSSPLVRSSYLADEAIASIRKK